MTEMEVDFFSVSQGYGFCEGGGQRVFFRVESFAKGHPEEPFPISGETVLVEGVIQGERSPRAQRVVRKHPPVRLQGKIKSFDSKKGWGFIDAEDGSVLFMHRSDFLMSPFLPLVGSCVEFYSGSRRGKPRACYVQSCRVE